MYHTFYELRTDPFRLTPDPAFCFAHERYARALAYMQYALSQGEGFIMVTGLPGTGKTTLIETFRAEINKGRTLVARLDSTQVHADELLRLIGLSLGVDTESADKASMVHRLRAFLVRQADKGRRVLLLIDEAQDLPVQTLEELRLLGNLQLNARPLLQIFLVGQQQLLDMVRLPAMRPLYQRLVAACHLEPLNPHETRAYIEYRLGCAGWRGEPPFDAPSYRMIHCFAEGFPRQINKVCSRLLLYGSTEHKRRLDRFDCIKVLQHWLEEMPGSVPETSFQDCVAMLDGSWDEHESALAPASSDAPRREAPALAEAAVGEQAAARPGNRTSGPRETPQAAGDRPRVGPAPRVATAIADTRSAAVHQNYAAMIARAVSGPEASAFANQPAATAAKADSPVRETAEEPVPEGISVGHPVAADAAGSEPVVSPRRRLVRRLWPPAGRNRAFARRLRAPLGAVAVLLVLLLFIPTRDDPDGPGEGASERALVVAGIPPGAADPVPGEAPDHSGRPEADAGAPREQAWRPAAQVDKVEPAPADEGAPGGGPAQPEQSSPAVSTARSLVAAPIVHDDGGVQGPETRLAGVPPPDSEPPAVQPASAQSGPPQRAAEAEPAAADAAPRLEVAEAAPSRTDEQDAGAAASVRRQAAVDPEQERIADLMARAERALQADRLSVPQGKSAFHYYREVLAVQPRHDGARTGLERVAARYAVLVRRALAQGEIDKAQTYVARALRVRPGNGTLLALQQDVRGRQILLENQAALAVAEAEAQPQPLQRTAPPEPDRPRRFLEKLKALFSNPVPRDMPDRPARGGRTM